MNVAIVGFALIGAAVIVTLVGIVIVLLRVRSLARRVSSIRASHTIFAREWLECQNDVLARLAANATVLAEQTAHLIRTVARLTRSLAELSALAAQVSAAIEALLAGGLPNLRGLFAPRA